jgi:hypothetical protein
MIKLVDLLKEVLLTELNKQQLDVIAKLLNTERTSEFDGKLNSLNAMGMTYPDILKQVKDGVSQDKSFDDILNSMSSITGKSSKELESDFDTIIDNNDLTVMVPHTHAASRKLGLSHFAFRDCEEGGKDSAWCTTYKIPDHFDDYYYNRNITLYYIKVKSPQMIEQLKIAFPKKWERMVVIALGINNDGTIFGYDGLDGVIPKKDIKIFTNITGVNKILVQRRSPEERQDDYLIVAQKQIQQYIKDGSKGNLNLSKNPILSLPNNLSRVGGNLFLYSSKITSLPDNLEVGGDLVVSTLTSALPKGLKVGGDLDLQGSKITSLPDDLEIGKDLYLQNSKIKSLPDNLKVKGSLSLSNTKITSLPDNLEVGGDLYLFRTSITSLPNNLKARNIQAGGSNITFIPKGSVADSVNIAQTPFLESLFEKFGKGNFKEILKFLKKEYPGIKGWI